MTDPDPVAIDAIFTRLLAEYGGFLDEEQRQDVRRRVESLHRVVEAIRRIPLANGEAPTWPVRPFSCGS